MNLFEDTALFDEGKERCVDFQLPGTELQLREHFFSRAYSDIYFKILLTESPWEQRVRQMYDRVMPDPRLTASYGGVNGNPWSPVLLEIKSKIEASGRISFDRVLLNYYRDGNDSVAWHSDTLPADGKHHHIASVTFGETRIFKVRHKLRKELSVDIPLRHGSFLLMGESMQENYEHHIPKTARKIGPRINLTFRISERSKPVFNSFNTRVSAPGKDEFAK